MAEGVVVCITEKIKSASGLSTIVAKILIKGLVGYTQFH